METETIGQVSLQKLDGDLDDASVLIASPKVLSGWLNDWVEWSRETGLSRELFNWPAICANEAATTKTVAIVRDGACQGLIQLATSFRYQCRDRKITNLVYVPFLEAAPWNVVLAATRRRYRNVGTTLLLIATSQSSSLNFDGRVGLNSIEQARGFYEHHGFAAKFGADCDSIFYETYMELEAEAAELLILRSRRAVQ